MISNNIVIIINHISPTAEHKLASSARHLFSFITLIQLRNSEFTHFHPKSTLTSFRRHEAHLCSIARSNCIVTAAILNAEFIYYCVIIIGR